MNKNQTTDEVRKNMRISQQLLDSNNFFIKSSAILWQTIHHEFRIVCYKLGKNQP